MSIGAILGIVFVLAIIIGAIIYDAHERNKRFRENELIRQNELEKAKEEMKERKEKKEGK